uniref:RRM domain-containing protein n=1 Tax=Auxenochlorella protothecoides TaxID=3075 RepID=A0A1D2AHD4_AUXPR
MAYYHRPNGHHLRRVSPPPAEQPCKLFLFNLAKCVTDSDLRPLFAPFKPQYAKVALGKKGQSRRFGFALFETQDQADAAQSALQGRVLRGQAMEIKPALAGEPTHDEIEERRLPTPKSRYLASDRSGNAYCPNTRKPPMVMDVSDMSQPRRPAHQDDQENLEWRSKADRLPAYEQRSRLSLMPRTLNNQDLQNRQEPRWGHSVERRAVSPPRHLDPIVAAPQPLYPRPQHGKFPEVMQRPNTHIDNREDVQRAATPPPDPVAPTTLPSAQLLDVQGKSIAPLQQGGQASTPDQAAGPKHHLCEAALSVSNLSIIFAGRDAILPLAIVEELLCTGAPHAFGQVLSGALVRVLDHGRYRLRIVDEVTFDARGKIVLVLNDTPQFVLAGTVSNTNCLQSDDCGKEELAELISSLHSLGRTITVHDMAATMWRLSAARAWWDVMTINGMLSVDAVDRLPELVALLNQHDGPHTCYDLVEAAGVGGPQPGLPTPAAAHGVQDSHQGENTWKEEPSASGPSRDSGPTPDSASDPGSKASLTPKPSDMAPVPRQLFGSPKHGLVGTEVSSPFHGPTLTPA